MTAATHTDIDDRPRLYRIMQPRFFGVPGMAYI